MRQFHAHVPLIVIASCLTLAALPACRDAGDASDTPAAAPSDAPANRIAIPAVVRENLGIRFAKVERRDVANTIRVPGSFELEPLARHEYRLMLAGRVEFLVEQYEPVEPGTPLYRFRSPQWPELQHEIIVGEQEIASADAAIAVAQATLDEARARLAVANERIERLAQADFKRADLEEQASELGASIPRLEAELHLARTKRANAERTHAHALHRASAAAGLAEEELVEAVEGREAVPLYRTIDWITQRATEPGVVEALYLTDGAYAVASSIVLSTVDPTRVRFRAMALQSDLSRLTNGPSARIVPPQRSGVDIADALPAALIIGLDAHPEQRTLPLIATPAELRDWTRPGVSAFLEVVVESSSGPALAIPRSAVVKDGLTHVFFRRDPQDPNKAIRVVADLGVDDGRWVVIHSGVALGDEVVLEGAYELKLATAAGGAANQGGHFHADGTFHDGDD